ncbi:hypothetical protein ElyMa_006881000 [Elysia marginata]|uniref:Uncharacterized protein n=1 Tax=Elysia marginata TaxID=1093978 RepID=A0AAV4JCI0_9GAST|nr:hypothetical protein ElyMa_006881000 [Elysia marginata]
MAVLKRLPPTHKSTRNYLGTGEVSFKLSPGPGLPDLSSNVLARTDHQVRALTTGHWTGQGSLSTAWTWSNLLERCGHSKWITVS